MNWILIIIIIAGNQGFRNGAHSQQVKGFTRDGCAVARATALKKRHVGEAFCIEEK